MRHVFGVYLLTSLSSGDIWRFIRRIVLTWAILLVCSGRIDAATWFVAPSGNDANNGTSSWTAAKATIQAAIDASTAGDTVLVSNGVYATGGKVVIHDLTNRVAIDKAITVQSVNGPAVTIIQGQGPLGSNAVRCAYVTNGASLVGFTLTNGHAFSATAFAVVRSGGGAICNALGVISNCIIVGNTSLSGGGGVNGGTVLNSLVAGNTAGSSGGGIDSAIAVNCIISNNVAATSGGGLALTRARDCIITRNRAGTTGGGAQAGGLTNCIVSYNTAGTAGGGLNSCSARNSAIFGNTAGTIGGGVIGTSSVEFRNCTITGNSAFDSGGANGARILNSIVYNNWAPVNANWSAGTYSNSCTFPMPLGTGNITNEPALSGISHLSTASPCVDAGLSIHAGGADIDGEGWNSPPSMGCDEMNIGSLTGPLMVRIYASHTNNVAAGYPITFFALIEGRTASSRWNFANGTILTNRAVVQNIFTAGTFAVSLTAFNSDFPAGVSTTLTVQVTSQVVHFVRANNSGQAAPYTSWATASSNIQQAVDAATQVGAMVLVSNGNYNTGGKLESTNSFNRVTIDKPLFVRSVNGPSFTTILGAGPMGTSAVRCVFLGNYATLSGFTLSGGYTRTNGHTARARSGGGAYCETFGVISNCVLSGNFADRQGGGVQYGSIYNSIFTNNAAILDTNNASGSASLVSLGYGGGASESVAYDCTFVNNSAKRGAGAYIGWYYRCSFSRNIASTFAGGVIFSTAENCVFLYNNGGSRGGAASESILANCLIVGNTSSERGGGTNLGTNRNCTIIHNETFGGGDGFGGGGGTYRGSNVNCIVYFNKATGGNNWADEFSQYHNCTTTPMPPGSGNITDNPLLASLSHISLESPCIGAGATNATVGVDIDGESWASPPSIGCDEVNVGSITGVIYVHIAASYTNVAAGAPIDFRADITGRITRSVWNFGNGTVVTNQPLYSHTFASTGNYLVVLTAFNETFPGGVSTSLNISVIQSITHYVRINNSTPVAPYTNWTTAATNIQHAIDAATQVGALILVSNGTYNTGGKTVTGSLTNRVAIDKPLHVRSVNGPAVTEIVGIGGMAATSARCVYLFENSSLSGFTLRNGSSTEFGAHYEDYYGGGAFCAASSVISNCVLSANQSPYGGGGVFRGTLYNCTVANNSLSFLTAGVSGGGALGATLISCLVVSNTAINDSAVHTGGGAANCTLINCTIMHNRADFSGGGAQDSTLIGCTLISNSAQRGGAAAGGYASNCVFSSNVCTNFGGATYFAEVHYSVITNNISYEHGGGVYGGSIYNSRIAGNRANISGGGLHSATAFHCTIVTNKAVIGNGGGAHGGDNESPLYNCLVFGNTAVNGGGVADVGMRNCTVAGNTASTRAGGLFVSSFGWNYIYNCIIYSNNAPLNPNWYTESVDALYYTCTTPSPNASNLTVTLPPQFVDYAAMNLRLQASSPCINTGNNTEVTTVIDLDGNPRISGSKVDLGAYEFQEASETDTDGDGIPDWWETLYYGGATNANPTALASNGVNTVLEAWIADLIPTNSNSVFKVVTITNAAPGLLGLMVNPSSTARVYEVSGTTNLLGSQNWLTYGGTQTGTGTGLIFSVTNNAPFQHYRTRVTKP